MSPPRNSKRVPEAGPLDATDPQSFAAHYREAYPRLTLVAAGVTGDRQSAEDIVQEAAVIAFEKAARFTPGTNFGAWLAEIAALMQMPEGTAMSHVHRSKAALREKLSRSPSRNGSPTTGPTLQRHR